MTEIGEIYKCEICGNIVSMVATGKGKLVCCGQEMKLFSVTPAEKEGKEKHIPVIKIGENNAVVNVGSVPHPMEENHYIEWIEVVAGDRACRKFLKPGDKPEAEFSIEARGYRNLHGLWKPP